MTLYSVVVFLHVLSATGIVAALSLEGLTLARVTHAPTLEAARDRLGGFSAMQWVGTPATVFVLASGLYLAQTWHWKAEWLGIAMPAFLLLPILGGTLTRKGVGALHRMVAGAAGGGAEPLRSVRTRGLWVSWWMRLGTVVGIVFLMEVKPPLGGGLLMMSVVLAAGFVAGFVPLPRRAVS